LQLSELPEGHEPKGILNKHTTSLYEVATACVYSNESLIVVRKHGLVEYPFRRGRDGIESIDRNGQPLEVRDFRISTTNKSKAAVVNNGERMLVIICNWDYTIYMVAFKV